jgi:molybdopterin/thiamine biosynthesis adenylyltransferase
MTIEGQAMVLTVANLMSRWCRDIAMDIVDAPLLPSLARPGMTHLHARIQAEIQDADPFGRFVFGSDGSDERLTLGIARAPATISIDADGWRAHAGRGSEFMALPKDSNLTIGGIIAACFGVARIFKLACGIPDKAEMPWQLDAFTMTGSFGDSNRPSKIPTVDLGRVLLVGAGAVGSAICHFVPMLPVQADWLIVDHDQLKILNLNRSPLFGLSNVPDMKADICALLLREHGQRSAEAYPVDLGTFLNEHERKPNAWDLVLPEANEYGARLLLQSIAPPLMVHGTTGTRWDVTRSRHIPIEEACLACRYPNDGSQPSFVCSTGDIPVEGEVHRAALPFISPLAAVLALADVIKVAQSDIPLSPNAVYISLAEDDLFVARSRMRILRTCICRSQLDISRRYNAGSRFWKA